MKTELLLAADEYGWARIKKIKNKKECHGNREEFKTQKDEFGIRIRFFRIHL